MKRLLSYFRPEEAIAVFFLSVLGIFNTAGAWNLRRPYSVLVTAYTESYFLPVVTLLLISVFAWRKRGIDLNPVRDWLPFVLCFLTYEFLHDFVHWINPHDQDRLLASIDAAIFGVQPTVWLERAIEPGLTGFLSFCYVCYFFFPPTLGFVLYFRRELGPFRDMMLSVVIACFLGYMGYLLVPAVGPKYFLSGLYNVGLDGNAVGDAVIFTVDALKPITRDCFPSLHTALTTVVLIYAWRYSRLLFWALLPIGLGLFFSTIYLRYHYFIDVVAGWALAYASTRLAESLNRWWYVNIKPVIQ